MDVKHIILSSQLQNCFSYINNGSFLKYDYKSSRSIVMTVIIQGGTFQGFWRFIGQDGQCTAAAGCPVIWPFVCPAESPRYWIRARFIHYCSACFVKRQCVTAHLDQAHIRELITLQTDVVLPPYTRLTVLMQTNIRFHSHIQPTQGNKLQRN